MCVQKYKMNSNMQIVIKTVNFIKAKRLNHSQFQELTLIVAASLTNRRKGTELPRPDSEFYYWQHVFKSFMASKTTFA